MPEHVIPFGAALEINPKRIQLHATNGCVVFSCMCGTGPILIASFDSVVTCQQCRTPWRIGKLVMEWTPTGIEVAAKLLNLNEQQRTM